MNLFSQESFLMRFLNLVADIVVLHFLWVIFSLPIVTIGASTTALYYSCMKRIRTNEGYIAKNFFKSFKSNFLQSTIIWLIMAGVGILLFVDIRIGMSVKGFMGRTMVAANSFLLIPYTFIFLYIFPVQAKFENKTAANFKNAFLMSIQNLHYTLLLIIISGSFVFLTLFFRPFIGFMLACGISTLCYLLSGIFVIIFRKYIPEEFKEDSEINDPHGL